MQEVIRIRGARTHNLKNVDVDIPVGKITCISGPSGSGKSSLAFHTLYTESKRRFLNSFPNYIKFFMERPPAPDVDDIFPVLPVFGLPQNNPVMGARSCVSDVLGITDRLANLFSYQGTLICPEHKVPLKERSFLDDFDFEYDPEEVIHVLLHKLDYLKYFGISTPARSSDGDEVRAYQVEDPYFEVFRIKGKGLISLEEKIKSSLQTHLTPQFFLFRKEMNELIEVEKGHARTCPECDYSFEGRVKPEYFSPYNALGACAPCGGHGKVLRYDREKLVRSFDTAPEDEQIKVLSFKRFRHHYPEFLKEAEKNNLDMGKIISKQPEKFWTLFFKGGGVFPGVDKLLNRLEKKRYKPSVRIFIRGLQTERLCTDCEGLRLGELTKAIEIEGHGIQDILTTSIGSASETLSSMKEVSSTKNSQALRRSLLMAEKLGLGYLNLLRKTKNLTPGEYQRLLMIKYLAYEGTGALFIFDEPSLGLGQKEQKNLYKALELLRDQGNTVILVDHSLYFQNQADQSIEMGPGSGSYGGEVLFSGKRKTTLKLPRTHLMEVRRTKDVINLEGLKIYGLELEKIKIPLNSVTWVTGDSGTGKTCFLVKVLANHLYRLLHREKLFVENYELKKITGHQKIEDVLVVSTQSTRFNSRSTVGSLSGLGALVRKELAKLPQVKQLGLTDSHFSTNTAQGMCHGCEGKGVNIIEMQFLEDVAMPCEDCRGLGLNSRASEILVGERTIFEIYTLPLNQIIDQFNLTPKYRRLVRFMKDLNLDHLSLSRKTVSLSGGEKQRLYLLSKLEKNIHKTLIVFENLSFGLSTQDILKFSAIFNSLLENQNTIILIDPNRVFQNLSHLHLEFLPDLKIKERFLGL